MLFPWCECGLPSTSIVPRSTNAKVIKRSSVKADSEVIESMGAMERRIGNQVCRKPRAGMRRGSNQPATAPPFHPVMPLWLSHQNLMIISAIDDGTLFSGSLLYSSAELCERQERKAALQRRAGSLTNEEADETSQDHPTRL